MQTIFLNCYLGVKARSINCFTGSSLNTYSRTLPRYTLLVILERLIHKRMLRLKREEKQRRDTDEIVDDCVKCYMHDTYASCATELRGGRASIRARPLAKEDVIKRRFLAVRRKLIENLLGLNLT